jgi:hypothetical protein
MACRKNSKNSFLPSPEPGIEVNFAAILGCRIVTLLRDVNRFSQICLNGEGKSPFYVAITL